MSLRHIKVTLFMMIYLTVDELGNKHGILQSPHRQEDNLLKDKIDE